MSHGAHSLIFGLFETRGYRNNRLCTTAAVFGEKNLEKNPLVEVAREPIELLDRLRYQRTTKQLDPAKEARIKELLDRILTDCKIKGIQVIASVTSPVIPCTLCWPVHLSLCISANLHKTCLAIISRAPCMFHRNTANKIANGMLYNVPPCRSRVRLMIGRTHRS